MAHIHLTRREWLLLSSLAVARAHAQAETVHEEIRALADQAPLGMQFRGGTAAECRAWQKSFAAKLSELLGPYQPPREWRTETERTVDLDDHRRQELVLHAEGLRPLPVYLLTPRGAFSGKRPGLLALHGHGKFGYESVAGVATTDEGRQEIAELHYDYGVQLVRRGYVVAVPCFTPFGRRVGDEKPYKKQDACGITFIRMQALGKLLIAENLRDALWSLALLSREAGVDAARLGCAGLSYGGRMTMLTAAVAPQIRVAVISGALNLIQERITGYYGCGAQIIPGLLQYGDVPEISSLIAPRPCLWEIGRQDALMVKDRIEPALERMRRAWGAFGALENLRTDSFEGKHQWNGVEAYPLLERVLKP
jgi:dienelactone hydrolase